MQKFRTKVQSRLHYLSAAVLILILGLLSGFNSAAAAQSAPTRTPTLHPQQNRAVEPDVTVIISEPYLNQLVEEALEDRPDLQDPAVDLKEGSTAVVSATMPLGYGLSARPRAIMELAVVNGQVEASIVRFDLSGISVPRSVVSSRLSTLEEELNQTINQELVSRLKPAGLRLTGVETHETQMDIEMQAVQQAGQP